MRNNYQVNQWMTPTATAILGNVLYILLVVTFKEVGKLFPVGGFVNLVYNLAVLGVTLLFWMLYFAFVTRNIIDKRYGGFFKYIFLMNLPIFIFTGFTTFLVYYTNIQGFSANWNAFNFIVAPTLFWFLPFGAFTYIWDTLPLPLWVYPYMALAVTVVFQSVGIALTGQYRRKILGFAQERRKRLEEQEAADYAQLTAKAIHLQQAAQNKKNQKKKKIDKSRVWEKDSTQIIYTESFDLVTDEMIDAYNKQQEAQSQQNTEVEISAATATPETVAAAEVNPDDKLDRASRKNSTRLEGVNQTATQPSAIEEVKQDKADDQIEEQLDESKMESKNIQAELDKIRDLINLGKLK